MTFTLTALRPLSPVHHNDSSHSDESDPDDSLQIDSHRPAKRPKLSSKSIVTPGEIVTDDPQWMRYVTSSYNQITESSLPIPCLSISGKQWRDSIRNEQTINIEGTPPTPQRPRHLQPHHHNHHHPLLRSRLPRPHQQAIEHPPPPSPLHPRNRRLGHRADPHRRNPAMESRPWRHLARPPPPIRNQFTGRNPEKENHDG